MQGSRRAPITLQRKGTQIADCRKQIDEKQEQLRRKTEMKSGDLKLPPGRDPLRGKLCDEVIQEYVEHMDLGVMARPRSSGPSGSTTRTTESGRWHAD